MKANVKINIDKKGVAQAVMQATNQPIGKAALLVERRMKKKLRVGGFVGLTSGGRNKYAPSNPPKAPHLRTGNLMGSVSSARTDRGTYIVGPGRSAWYGRIHETGGEFGGRKYPARPFARPSLDETWPAFPSLFKSIGLGNTPAGQKLNSKKGKGR